MALLQFLLVCLVSGLMVGTGMILYRFRQSVLERLDHIIENKRLSTVLYLSPASLTIDPSRFAPNKEALKTRLLEKLQEWWHKGSGSTGVDNLMSIIIEQSGWNRFVTSDTRSQAQRALVRLYINGDFETAKALCEELVDKL